MTEFREKIFLKLFETAEIAKFTPQEYQQYEDSLKYYRDLKNSLDTAREEGREEGRLEEKKGIAKEMINKGFDISTISEITGLSKDEIEKLKKTSNDDRI